MLLCVYVSVQKLHMQNKWGNSNVNKYVFLYHELLAKDILNVSSCSGGRKIHLKGSNMELVESVTVFPSNKVLKTQYNTSSGVRCVYYFCSCSQHDTQKSATYNFRARITLLTSKLL